MNLGLGLGKPFGFREDGLWIPSKLPGYTVELRSDAGVFSDTAGTTPILNGGAVALWRDQSGNGHDVVQATAGARPHWTASNAHFGGKPSVDHDVITNPKYLASAVFGVAMVQPTTWYVVGLISAGAPGSPGFIDGNTARNAILSDGTHLDTYAGSLLSSATAPPTNVGMILVGVFDAASSLLYKSTTQIASGGSGSQGLDQLFLGATANGLGDGLAGSIVHVVGCLGHHTPTTIAKFVSYAQVRYGIT